ncbi:Crp/Fnr family transcriptional regulator [Aureispira anguillae]|uniref:Crp/Fnr family transcriptional regulator n=1 Tax=Aureispira anguillae TaxID=2864201 RepID=A0A915YFK5_9BACT|nr:Crp/Fnr family transcriptional regulator [Aureispira anguillae]BDS12120.1 Crp/Fnr family transcriptional regulator [Aureispira anguillae]
MSTAFEQLWTFMDQYVLFSKQEKAIIQPYFIQKKFNKQNRLVDLGSISKEVFFIVEGCLRYYYITEDGREITGFIFQENMFAGSHNSFFNQVPSSQVLETIEASTVLSLNYTALMELYQKVPKMNELVRKILEHRFAFAQSVIASLITNKPEERYRQLIQQQPNLVHRVPLHILATYLGITPVSLSRIRARKAKK